MGVADDFGPNAKIGSSASALGQLDVYEVTTPRRLEWVDLYLRTDLGGTRLTISVYEAPAKNMAFRRLTSVQVDVPPCVGWVGTGPLGIPLQVGRFYAIGFDPNQAVTTFVDSESNDLPIDGQFGRLIGSMTSTSVSLDTLDFGMPSSKSFTRQRLFTSPRASRRCRTTRGPTPARLTRGLSRRGRFRTVSSGLKGRTALHRRFRCSWPRALLHAQTLDRDAAD